MNDFVVRRVRPWARLPDAPHVDVVVRSGLIASVEPAVDGTDRFGDTPTFDGHGGLLLPAFADVHAHLDSTRLGLPFRPHTAEPGLLGLVENDRRNWRGDGSVAERAIRTLGATVAAGTVRVRSHAQVDADAGLERVEGVLAARAAFEGRCDVQVVAFPQSGIIRDPPTADLLGAAVDAEPTSSAASTRAAFDRDPVAHLDVVFGVAERKQVGVDLHLHEVGELGAFTIELIAERTRALGMEGNVTISHVFALSSVDPARQAALIELLAACDIGITTVAPGNREPLPIDALRAAGVRVGLGQDGVRDYWSPYGNGDMLERAWQLAFRAGVRRDDAIEACVDVASRGGRAVFDRRPWSNDPMVDDTSTGLGVGAPADLVVVPADTVAAAVMDHLPRSAVFFGGRLVARDGMRV